MNFDNIVNRKGTYCTQWDYIKDRFGSNDLLPFTISDMDLESPIEIVESIIQRANHKIFGYSRWNNDDFKNAIEYWYKKRFNFNIDKDTICYSPSVIYAVSTFIKMKSKEEDNIIVFTPVYDGFFKTIKANNRNILELPLLKNTQGKYDLDFELFEEYCKKSSILLFCSPHNPIGKIWSVEELSKIIEICKKYDVFIISDEIHMDIAYTKHTPILKINTDYKKLVLITSASKTFNIPALIGAYLLIPNEKDMEEFLYILKDKDALSSASIFGVIATINAYNKCEYWLDELLEYTKKNIKYIITYLNKNIPELKCVMPESSYFACVDYSSLNIEDDLFQKYLIEVGKVAIMDGITYGEAGRYHLRINTACSIKKIEDCMQRISKTVDHIKSLNINN